jgi:hypothetical protein
LTSRCSLTSGTRARRNSDFDPTERQPLATLIGVSADGQGGEGAEHESRTCLANGTASHYSVDFSEHYLAS